MGLNEELKDFWNSVFQKNEAYEIKSKFINDEVFNDVINDLYGKDARILDFGCGSGWALPELYFTKKYKYGLGIDQSYNAIQLATEIAKKSGFDNMEYMCKDITNIDDEFDAIFSCNTLDVIPLDISKEILKEFKRILKPKCRILVSLNPYLDDELRERLNMELIGDKMFMKNGILRCVNLSNDEWCELFNIYFNVIRVEFFQIEGEKVNRRMFLMENK